jgi:hypothetical protein
MLDRPDHLRRTMTRHPATRPAPRAYPQTPTEEPVSDEMLVVTRKHYEPDGSLTPRTTYYQRPELVKYSVGEGVLEVELATTDDAPRTTQYFPLGELFGFAVEGPTAAYERAFDAWTQTSFGVDAETYRSMRKKSKGVTMAEKIRLQIADGLGVDPDDVHFGGSFSLDSDEDDDDDLDRPEDG